MNNIFICHARHMTYKHYLQQPKSMLEWRLNLILAENPELVRVLGDSFHPLIRKYNYVFDD